MPATVAGVADAVRWAEEYEGDRSAHEDCRMVYDRLPSPKQNPNALEATLEVAVVGTVFGFLITI